MSINSIKILKITGSQYVSQFYYIWNREEVLTMLSTVVKIAMLVSMTIKAIDDLTNDK